MRKTLHRKHTVRHGVIAVAISALLLVGGPALNAGGTGQSGGSGASSYTFVTVLDSERDGLVLDGSRCPAINTLGTVAMTVIDPVLGITKIITKRGADDEPVVIADTQRVADFPTLCDNGFPNLVSDPSINEKGEVAFQPNIRTLSANVRAECGLPPQNQRRQGVFVGKGGPLTTIAHSINQPGGNFIAEFLVADQTVNTLGRVAFVPELDNGEQGLFVGSKNGTIEQRFLADTPTADGFDFENISSRVSMNELGQVAFETGLNNAPVSGIFLSNPDGTFRTIVDNSGGLLGGDPSLNIFGRVAFVGERLDENFNQIFSINTSRGGAVTTVAETSPGGYASFDEPSLNDVGQVAFGADVQPDPNVFITFQGVFTGPDPVRDKVLQAGDRFRGAPITSVRMCAEGLNNLGQIVMNVDTENPNTFELRRFVVRATPR
jgi:hypothetical protein